MLFKEEGWGEATFVTQDCLDELQMNSEHVNLTNLF